MKKLSFFTLCLFELFISQAQSDSAAEKKQELFISSIRSMDIEKIKERHYAINDSQVVLAGSFYDQPRIPAENIRSFSSKRKTNALEGGLIGFGVGAIPGIFIGRSYFRYFDEPGGKGMVVGGLAFGAAGFLVGTLVGVLIKKKNKHR